VQIDVGICPGQNAPVLPRGAGGSRGAVAHGRGVGVGVLTRLSNFIQIKDINARGDGDPSDMSSRADRRAREGLIVSLSA
jgi:hypothetical protein